MTGWQGQVAIASPTLVRNPLEELLLRGALESLARLELPLFVCDGGSGADFTSFVRRLPRTTLVPSSGAGLVEQVKASLRAAHASGAAFVLYTEPDKQTFFEQKLEALLTRAPRGEGIGVVLAGRSSSSFGTYPGTQRYTEGTINHLCGAHLGAAGDYSYGPFLLHREMIPHADAAGPELGWGWRHFMFAIAHRLGRQIVHVEGDFPCPEDQRHEDECERLHRLRQLGQNGNGLVAGLSVDVPQGSSLRIRGATRA